LKPIANHSTLVCERPPIRFHLPHTALALRFERPTLPPSHDPNGHAPRQRFVKNRQGPRV
jgi:hypothetical protein